MADGEMTTEIITQSELTTEELITEIKKRIGNTTQNIVEIGQLLIKAKNQVPHGEWGKWLADNIDFTIRTADRFMKCAERFSNWTPASNLNSSQMFELLALKKSDTEEFFNQKTAEGKAIEQMSKKALRDEVKQWKDFKRNETQNVDSIAESSQTSDSEVSEEQIKKLSNFFKLTEDLSNVADFDKLVRVSAEKDSEKMKNYSEMLFKLAQSIQNVINS